MLELRILGKYFSLGQQTGQFISLECKSGDDIKRYWLYYDLFSESFELALNHSSNNPPDNIPLSPFANLIDDIFSFKKFPNLSALINLSHAQCNHELTMRLRQAVFLKRLNSVDRLETLALPIVQIYAWELHHDTQNIQNKFPAAALWMTWQRQLSQLLTSSSLPGLPLIKRFYLQNDYSKPYQDGLLINSQYTTHEAIWISSNDHEKPLVIYDTKSNYFGDELESDTGIIDWIPKFKHSTPLTMTQFTYEKNIHPIIVFDQEYNGLYVANCYVGDGHLERYSHEFEIEHVIIHPNTKWLATIDSARNVMIYNMTQRSEVNENGAIDDNIITVESCIKLDENAPENFALFILDDKGALYYPKDNSWVENNGSTALWSPPSNFYPVFVSHDQRFLGFKEKTRFDVILYDQKRKLMRLLKRPIFNQSTGELISVAFSALNAVLALAFDDDNIFLYDLINEYENDILNPMGNVVLDNLDNNRIHNNILMRFEDVLDTLTIIHPSERYSSYLNKTDVVYARSVYSFNIEEGDD